MPFYPRVEGKDPKTFRQNNPQCECQYDAAVNAARALGQPIPDNQDMISKRVGSEGVNTDTK